MVAPGTAPVFPESPFERSSGRVEGNLKVTGQLQYAADLTLPDQLEVAVVRSAYPHARIEHIDTDAAQRVPGVHAVLTGTDVAAFRFGRFLYDVPILAVDKVRFVGEMVAAVAAESRAIAEEAAALIDVTYVPLPAVFDPLDALKPDAPAVHDEPWSYRGAARGQDEPPNLMGRAMAETGGDIDTALAASDRIFDRTFRTQASHHGYLEPHSCTVWIDGDERVNVWSCNKGPYQLRNQLSNTFGLPPEQFTIHTPAVGGDFGGKGTPMDIPLCMVFARQTGRPVRMTMRYTEELMAAAPRHASVIRLRVGVSNTGRLQAVDMYAAFNSGAYGGFRPGVNFGAQVGTSYKIPAVRGIADRVYTNQVPGGNARAPGAPQITFAFESMLDVVAREMGIDPITFRRNNLLRTGEVGTFGEHYPEARSLETLDLAEQSFRPAYPAGAPRSIHFGRGIAVYDRATHAPQRTSIRLRLRGDGSLEAQIPQMETGTGSHTILRRVVAEALMLPVERVLIRYVGTDDLPWDSGVGASRVSISGAEAAHNGALAFREQLREHISQRLAVPLAQVEMRDGCVGVDTLSGRSLSPTDLAAAGVEVEVMHESGLTRDEHMAVTGFCAQIAQVGVDVETGQIYLYEVLSANDVAEVLDLVSHNGQIIGGVVTGIGYALTEDLRIEEGQVTAAHLGDYKLPSIADAATVRVVLLPNGIGMGARNIKSIGETGNVPTAAAIANAVADAVGIRIYDLPITAEKVYRALQQHRIP